MTARVLGVFTAAAGFAADVVLAGEAAGAHGAQGPELGFQLVDPLLEVSLGGAFFCFHIR